jgi:hypothetical protein
MDAKTIQIFLPDGEPRGIRIAEMTTRIVQAIQFPRARIDRLFSRPELDHVGVYFLFGGSDESAKPRAYVSQTEDLRSRLKKHHADKDFWTTAVFLVSRTDSFTLAHIRYLEWHAIDKAGIAGRYTLENGNGGSKPFITEPMEADVLDAFEIGSVLLATLGFPLFDPVAGREKPGRKSELFHCTGPDARGIGHLVEDGFVVLKGSVCRMEIAPSAGKYVTPSREKLVSSGVLIPDGTIYRFTEDYLFDSPSGAAMTILGRTANGWIEWKTKDGRTLDAVERAHISDAALDGTAITV